MGKSTFAILGRVRLCSESYQTILVEVDCEWLKAGNKHVESKVILESTEEMRLHDVLIHHIGSLLWD